MFRNFARSLDDEEEARRRKQQRNDLEEPVKRPSVRETPYNPHHIISAETKLLNDIRDIRDELHMLRSLAEDQDVVWKQVFNMQEDKSSFQYYHSCMPLDIKKDLEEMLLEAEITNNSVGI